MTKILFGDKVASKILRETQEDIIKLKKKKVTPALDVILAGQDPESLIYVREKKKKAIKLGIKFKLHRLPVDIKEKKIIELIKKLNQEPRISGILVQLPLPGHLDPDKILETVKSQKEIDGITLNSPYPAACAQGILEILSFYKIPFLDKKIVILGAGRIIGRPLFRLFKKQAADVTVCDEKTKNITALTKKADILIGAMPVKDFVGKDMVKIGAVVIDAAKNIKKEVKDVAGYLTPQIGGVGPVTVAQLLKNVVTAAKTSDS